MKERKFSFVCILVQFLIKSLLKDGNDIKIKKLYIFHGSKKFVYFNLNK